MSSGTSDPPCTPGFWERTKVGWHAVYLGLLVIVAALVAADPVLSAGARRNGLLLLSGLALLYAVAGRHLLGQGRTVPAVAHLTLTWAGFLGLVAITDAGYLLLFALFPQVWAFLERNWAVAFTSAGVTGLVVLRIGQAGWTGANVAEQIGFGVLQLGVSLLLGLWITGIVRESERRAGLIAELERTRAELATSEHQRGVLTERERLAGEIHDTLAQGLTSILTLAQAIEVALDRDPAQVRARLALLEQTARDNLEEARALVQALGPADLRQATLDEAMRRLAGRFRDETGVPVDLTVHGEPWPLPAANEVVLLRAAQEALANARRHAAAGSVRVRLAYDGGGTSLEVRDDGRGFDPLDVEGYGLRGMRARVEQVGGELEVASSLGSGTAVRVRLPGPPAYGPDTAASGA